MKSESEVQQEIMMAAPYHSCILMRNNSGAFEDKDGRLVRYGLGHHSPKQDYLSSDLIGITTIVITPEMVGKKIGVLTAIEVKKENWRKNKTLDSRERKQFNFINWVRSVGGIAGFCTSVEDFKNIMKNYLESLRKKS